MATQKTTIACPNSLLPNALHEILREQRESYNARKMFVNILCAKQNKYFCLHACCWQLLDALTFLHAETSMRNRLQKTIYSQNLRALTNSFCSPRLPIDAARDLGGQSPHDKRYVFTFSITLAQPFLVGSH